MSQGSERTNPTGIQQVVDFLQVREQRLDEKRRKTERIFFKHLLSVYCVVGRDQMRPIELLEVSEDGCSFQVPYDANNPWPTSSDEDLPIRLYFSQDTYIPIHLKIQNSKPCIDQGIRYVRFGCTVDRSLSSYPAFEGFVKFLRLYSEHAHKDKGDISVFYL